MHVFLDVYSMFYFVLQEAELFMTFLIYMNDANLTFTFPVAHGFEYLMNITRNSNAGI